MTNDRLLPEVSIIVPVYFNADTLDALYEDIRTKILDQSLFSCEVVFVDDGSADESWQILQRLAHQDKRVRIFRLSRNFGSHAAILCGLSQARGRCAVVKAADLQEPTELVLQMVASWKTGKNVVLAVREGREEPLGQKIFAAAYYALVRRTALPQMPKGGFDVFLVDRKVIEVLERMDEKNSAITGQILWSGFSTEKIYYTRLARTTGKSRWSLKKKIRLVTDTLFSFSSLPIGIVTGIGLISVAGSIVWAVVALIARLAGTITVSGWTSMLIFNVFSFGIIMASLGLLGGYLWRTFDATRNRPPYIIEENGELSPTNANAPEEKEPHV